MEIDFSVVVPTYKCSKTITELSERLISTLSILSNNFEIIFVNDNSPENDWDVVMCLCENEPRIKGVNLSRNFGQHYAITAGLENAKGEWVIVMDGDLQDQPEEILKLNKKTKEGFDIVYARREIRQDSFLKKYTSKLFYKLFGYLTDSKQDASIANFGIYHKQVINSILSMKDHVRYFPTMVQWVGFTSTKVNVKHVSREEGESAYSWSSLIKLAVNNIIAFSDKPLKIAVRIGFFISFVSFSIGLYYLYKFLVGEIIILGFASLIISIWFLSGLIIMILGVLGIYIAKTFDRVKDRPTYIVSKKLNF
tara:strand:+ start:328 stop:1254 length:927 start_codon:yes stop_codon:yes gene_type:complete